MLVGSLRYNDGKVLGSDEGIKLGLSGCKVFGIILVNVDGITHEIDVGTYLGYIDRSFDGSNDGKPEYFFLGDSLGSTGGKVLGSGEGIKMGYTDDEVLVPILGNVDGSILGIDVGT